MCRRFADDEQYLIADLDVKCWHSPEHVRICILCTLLTAIVFAYPAVVSLLLHKLKMKNSLHSPVALHRYGFLYEGYTIENYQWGVFQIFKALVLSMINVLLETRPTVQVFVALDFLIACVAAHFYRKPFLHRHSDNLEAFFLFATCIMLGIGSTFLTLDAKVNNSETEKALFLLLHVLFITCLLTSLHAVYTDIRDRQLVEDSKRRMATLVNYARRVKALRDSQKYTDDEEACKAPEFEITELHESLKPGPLANWMRSIPSLSTLNSQSNDPEEPPNSQLLLDIEELDDWFGPALSDVGICSVFSNHYEAVFWRRIDLALPDLFEFLATASSETVVNLRVILGKLIGSYTHRPGENDDTRAHRIGYRELISKEDRSALLRCLVLADEGHRKQFFRLLDALAEAKRGEAMPARETILGRRIRVPRGYERTSILRSSSSMKKTIAVQWTRKNSASSSNWEVSSPTATATATATPGSPSMLGGPSLTSDMRGKNSFDLTGFRCSQPPLDSMSTFQIVE